MTVGKGSVLGQKMQVADGAGGVGGRRLAFVVATREFGGVERHLNDLIARLTDRGAQCTVICHGKDFYTQHQGGRRAVQLVGRPAVEDETFLSYWGTFLRARAHTIVFIKGWFDEFPLRAYVAGRLSRARRLLAVEYLLPDSPPTEASGAGVLNAVRRLLGWRARYMWSKRLESRLCQQQSVSARRSRGGLGRGVPLRAIEDEDDPIRRRPSTLSAARS